MSPPDFPWCARACRAVVPRSNVGTFISKRVRSRSLAESRDQPILQFTILHVRKVCKNELADNAGALAVPGYDTQGRSHFMGDDRFTTRVHASTDHLPRARRRLRGI